MWQPGPGAEYLEPANGAQPVTGRGYLVIHLIAGTTYYFTVRAIKPTGVSAPSNQVSAVPRSLPGGRGAARSRGGHGLEPARERATGGQLPGRDRHQGRWSTTGRRRTSA